MRERIPRTARSMFSRCMSIPGRSVALPRTHRIERAPKICEALKAGATCSSTVPRLALNDLELGHTEPWARISEMPSLSAWARTCFTADSSSSTSRGKEIMA